MKELSSNHIREPYMVTTIEAVNSTSVLTATIDGHNRVSVLSYKYF